jgi:hypothetical protein
MYTDFLFVKPKGRDHVEVLGIDRLMIKLFLRKQNERTFVDLLVQDRGK